ncbi:toxin glutamine deamidase domain-containing protein [Nonomuraea mangrovi]|uniref:Toxin glutamine deamidase domain-containing protein n=1 Tax=Nonomuraea mangrovi TaxID=2316207 RepID=A0ABW4T5R9_9ACTN
MFRESLPEGRYNPLIAEGVRWRDYEQAAESAPEPVVQDPTALEPATPDPLTPESGVQGSTVPGQVMPESGVQGSTVPGQVMPESGVQGSTVPGQVMPESGVQGSAVPGHATPEPAGSEPAVVELAGSEVAVQDSAASGLAASRSGVQGGAAPDSALQSAVHDSVAPGPATPEAAVEALAGVEFAGVEFAGRDPAVRDPAATEIAGFEPGVRDPAASATGVHDPDWFDLPNRPPRLADCRPYGVPGGLARTDPQAEFDLLQALPPGIRFADPRGTWVRLVNGMGAAEDPFRASNAADCALAVVSTWHGEPVVAAPRQPEYDPVGRPLLRGETGGTARIERWLGQRMECVGQGRQAYAVIARRLAEAGHGASAVIVVRWPAGGSHAWNAVNADGEVIWIDAQRGHMAVEPPYESVTGVFCAIVDRRGEQG